MLDSFREGCFMLLYSLEYLAQNIKNNEHL